MHADIAFFFMKETFDAALKFCQNNVPFNILEQPSCWEWDYDVFTCFISEMSDNSCSELPHMPIKSSVACHSCLTHTHTHTHAHFPQSGSLAATLSHDTALWPCLACNPAHTCRAEPQCAVGTPRPGSLHVTISKALSPQYSHSDSRSTEDTQALLTRLSLPV